MIPTGACSVGDGGRLSYCVAGTSAGRPPLLLLRPLGGSMRLWGELAARLAVGRPLIAFDPRGVGHSSDVPWWQTTRQMAADAVELLDALAIDQVDVFGLSLGGMVASWLAIDHPLRVHNLVLASTLPRASAISFRACGDALGLVRCLIAPDAEVEVELVRDVLSRQFLRNHPARVETIFDQIRKAPGTRRNLAALALAALRHSAEQKLRTVTAQTLLLTGALDPIAGSMSQAELCHALPNAEHRVIADSGHDMSLEAPETTAREVDRFLTDASGR